MKASLRQIRRFATAVPQLPPCKFTPPKYNGLSKEDVVGFRKKHASAAIAGYFKTPLQLVQGKMQFVWDETGKRYLDFHGGILTVSVGHSNERVNEAIKKQMDKFSHFSNVYYNEIYSEYVHALAQKTPKGLDNIFLVNSGGEANDMAIQLTKLWKGHQHFVCLRNCYVGNAYHITSMSTWKHNMTPMPGLERAIFPDVYRGPFQGKDAAELYADDVRQVIRLNTNGQVSGFIAEPVQGAGGFVPMPQGYLKKVYEYVRAADGLVIADEVQTGFGRLGTKYWGCIDQDAHPDIMTMAKGIGNGMPLAAVATRKEIADKLSTKAHFNTFGGNPLACASGLEVLKIIDEEKLAQNSEKIGNLLNARLQKMQKKFEKIGDVRGKGLMIGVELVKNKKTKEPAPVSYSNIMERARDYGLLIAKGGFYGNVIRISPMLICNEADANFAMDVLEQCFQEEQDGKITYFK